MRKRYTNRRLRIERTPTGTLASRQIRQPVWFARPAPEIMVAEDREANGNNRSVGAFINVSMEGELLSCI